MKLFQIRLLTGRPFRYLGPALLLFVLPLPLDATLPGEQGKLFVESFTPDDYGGHPQNWSVVQDERGIVYVANLEGVLEYDGARWRKVDHPSRISAWSVARDHDGTIFVGASGDLGYLSPDKTGLHRFVSLLDQVPESSATFGSIRQVLPTPDGVFFLETGHVFRWSHGEMTAWSIENDSSSSNRLLGNVDRHILLARQGEGILELRDGSFELIPGTESLGNGQVTALLPLDGALLVATSTEGRAVREIVREQSEDFTTGWTFGGTLHFVRHTPDLPNREALDALFQALDAPDRDAIVEGLDAVVEELEGPEPGD